MNKGLHLLSSILCLLLFSQSLVACPGNTSPILVTTTEDEGPGSLRSAIDCANSRLGPDTILFNIPGSGNHIIYVGSITGEALPALSDPGTLIDGSSQPGYTGIGTPRPLIELDGSRHPWTTPINALWVLGDACAIYALAIHDFPDDGIDVSGASNVQIGAPGRGNVIYNNGSDQDVFPNVPNTGPWEGCGIVLQRGANNCRIQSNIIGTDYNQGFDIGNEYCGILIRNGGDNHLIGGPDIRMGNVIAHHPVAISIRNGSTGCSLLRNSIYCNDTLTIDLQQNANNGIAAPVIEEANRYTASGTAIDGAIVDVYANTINSCANRPCQGRTYLGTTIAVGGTWAFDLTTVPGTIFTGSSILTAIATDNQGNSSTFADCRVVAGNSPCTQPDGTIWVTTEADEGLGSLRGAIECANATPGGNIIKFNIPGPGLHRIFVGNTSGEALPALEDISTIIDGSSQPGFGQGDDYSPLIILDGSAHDWDRPINALWVKGPYCEIYGLEIRNFPDDGIDITGVDYVVVGAPRKGNVLYANGWEQDYFPTLPNTGPWNGCGIVLKSGADRCKIQSNILGTNYTQSIQLPNEHCGIVVLDGGDNHLIGGTQPGEGNTIAYHKVGIRVSNASYGCRLRRNSLYCNDSIPINLIGTANLELLPPEIDTASTVFIGGSGATTDVVEVYIDQPANCVGVPCQGRYYLGQATVINGRWGLSAPFASTLQLAGGEQVTALAVDILGNTSTYTACQELVLGCTLTLSFDQVNDASCDLANGSFEIVASGANGALRYWVNNEVEPDAQVGNLVAGDYTVIAADALGCRDTISLSIGNSGYPSLSVDQVNDASCGLPNGMVELSAMGGLGPYSFDLGSGPSASGIFIGLSSGTYMATVSDAVGCTAEQELTVGDSPAPFMSVSNIVHASCDQNNGSFSVTASGGMPPYSFDIGNGATVDTFFSNLNSGLYTVTLTDHNDCATTASVTINNIDIQPIADFDYTMQGEMVSFENTSVDAASYSWSFGDGSSPSTGANPIHQYDRNSEFTVCLTATNACGDVTYCEVLEVVFALDVSGMVFREDGAPVGNALLLAGGAATSSANDGLFALNDLPPGNDYDLIPQKNTNWANGLTTFDIYLLQQHILDVEALASPYQMIAADINRSGTLTTFDIFQLRQLVLGTTDSIAGNTSWRFVPADFLFPNPTNPFESPFPESISYTALDRHQDHQDFVAIKTGDLNLSSDPLQLQIPDRELRLRTHSHYDKTTHLLTIDIRADHFSPMAALQLDFQFDPQQLHYVGLLPAALPEMSDTHTGLQQLEQGRLPIAWHEPQGRRAGTQLPPDALLFQLQFRLAAGALPTTAALNINNERMVARAFTNRGEALQLALENTNSRSTESPFRVLQNAPNPFREQTLIRFYLPEADRVELQLMNLSGQVLQQQVGNYEAGWQDWELSAKGLPAGVYWYEVSTGAYRGQGKMVIK